jgi:ATP-dependent exoDNAse (exonuclease V) beta subunit
MKDLYFRAADHKYVSANDDNISWTSVTKLISKFKPPFDRDEVATKASRNKKSKWYGLSKNEIISVWEKETQRALELGTWYHNEREKDLLACDTIERNGKALPIYKPIEEDGLKYSPDQRLTEGIYPEHFVYLKSAGICGQADRVEVYNNEVHVYDYKSNKEIKKEAYTSWDGVTSMLHGPLSHISDCNFNHYSLQLSVYMYIILKHNPHLKPGKMQLHHIIFENEGEDQYGYPIAKLDEQGNPIVKEIVIYDVPYLKNEVVSMINYMKLNS